MRARTPKHFETAGSIAATFGLPISHIQRMLDRGEIRTTARAAHIRLIDPNDIPLIRQLLIDKGRLSPNGLPIAEGER
ncbi:hypothetical protein K2Y11_00580 [bacterium]|nr:hypothetical protein [bacterium]